MQMRVIGHDPYAKNLPDYIENVTLSEIWSQSDVISLHCPLTEANREMVNADTLAGCRPGLILVNTARGGLINEQALLDSVRSGHVMSAGLDSFAVEPMEHGHVFQKEPRIILSPHIGGVTGAAYVNMGVAAASNALAVLSSQAATA